MQASTSKPLRATAEWFRRSPRADASRRCRWMEWMEWMERMEWMEWMERWSAWWVGR